MNFGPFLKAKPWDWRHVAEKSKTKKRWLLCQLKDCEKRENICVPPPPPPSFGERDFFYSLRILRFIQTRFLNLVLRGMSQPDCSGWWPEWKSNTCVDWCSHPLFCLHFLQALQYLYGMLAFLTSEAPGLALICTVQDGTGCKLCSFLPGTAMGFHYLCSPNAHLWLSLEWWLHCLFGWFLWGFFWGGASPSSVTW